MGNTNLLVQIMSASSAWQDVTADTMAAEMSAGLSTPGASKSRVGRCTLLLKNRAQTYNPDIGQTSVAAIDIRRRVRIRAAGKTSGTALQVLHNGVGGIGGTTSITASGSTFVIGNKTSVNYQYGQSFSVTAGYLSTIHVWHGASTGSPAGTATWEIRLDNAGRPGALVTSGTYTPTASADNTITPGASIQISTGRYWLVIKSTATQATDKYWTWQCAATDTYTGGYVAMSQDGGTNYTLITSQDAQCSVTTTLTANCYFSQTISTATTAADVWTLQWDARASFDSQYNADAVHIVTTGPGETGAKTVVTYTNKWVTYSLTFTATANATTIEPRFLPCYAATGLNSQAVEYRNITLKKGAGSNVLGALSAWTTTNVGSPASSNALSVIPDYWTLWMGMVDSIAVAPFKNGGPLTTTVKCVDYTQILKEQLLDLPLQKSQRADQLFNTLFGVLPSNTLNTTLPGRLFATGISTFSRAFDGYTRGKTVVMDGISDTVTSEYGLMWVDRDGTLRFGARDFIPKQVVSAARFAVVDGMPVGMTPIRDVATMVNSVELTYHPRQTIIGGGGVLGQIQSYMVLPPKNADGTPGVLDVTLTYRDATGKTIGGDNIITPLVAYTDFQFYENLPNYGDYNAYPAAWSVTVPTQSASQSTIHIESNAIGSLYLTKLQIRGDQVLSYDPITLTATDASSIGIYGLRQYGKDLPFADDANYCQSLCKFIVARYSVPYVEVQSLSADWKDQLAGVDVLGLELMDMLTISDTQTGMSTVRHLITGWSLSLTPQGIDYIGTVTWELERMDATTYWILGDATYGALGTTTRLFI